MTIALSSCPVKSNLKALRSAVLRTESPLSTGERSARMDVSSTRQKGTRSRKLSIRFVPEASCAIWQPSSPISLRMRLLRLSSLFELCFAESNRRVPAGRESEMPSATEKDPP